MEGIYPLLQGFGRLLLSGSASQQARKPANYVVAKRRAQLFDMETLHIFSTANFPLPFCDGTVLQNTSLVAKRWSFSRLFILLFLESMAGRRGKQ